MIPYDDLVAALSAWRARQGLPVSTMGATPGSGPTAAPPAPVAKTPSGPKTPPPGPPPARSKATSVPPPLAAPDHDAFEVEDAALLDESSYENEGDDFAMKFGVDGDNSTAIGGPPMRDSITTDPVGAPPTRGRGKRPEDDW
jgi:hypothetical protein